jgi:hypothetical protein
MRKTLKITALLSILLITSLLLSSCGVFYFRYEAESVPNADALEDIDGPLPPIINSPSHVDFGMSDSFNPEAMLERFHSYNFDGALVTVATSGDKNPLFPDSGLIADANLYTVSGALQEKFDISLTKFSSELKDLIKTLDTAHSSGNNYADIVAIPLSAVPSFEGKNIFYKISSLPFINGDAEYFSENENLEITGEYFIAGSASYRISDTKVIYFNTEMLESLGAKSPYTLLSSKKWTWNRLIDYLSLGKGIAAQDDIFSLIMATSDEKSRAVDTVAAYLTEKIAPSLISENAKDKFLGGEALFYVGTLGEIDELNKSDTAYGLLPIPLFEDGDDYKRFHHSDDITVFACAKSSPDPERAAIVISAANASCYGSFESFFFTATKNSFLRDNGSNLSLGYICSGENAVIFPVSAN